jgi:membrane protein implicated in regulation of membrane protease activity
MNHQVKNTLVSFGIVTAILAATPLIAVIGFILQFAFIVAVPTFLVAALVSPRFRRWLEQPSCPELPEPYSRCDG